MQRRSIAVAMGAALSAVCAITILIVLLFRGYFDSSTYEVIKSAASGGGLIAILARRSDHQAMNGDNYFVLTENHLYTSSELRRAHHSHEPIFDADRPYDIRWTTTQSLVIECKDCHVTNSHVNSRRFTDKGIAIRYVGFP